MKIIKKIKKRILLSFFDWQKEKYDFYPQNRFVANERINEYLNLK